MSENERGREREREGEEEITIKLGLIEISSKGKTNERLIKNMKKVYKNTNANEKEPEVIFIGKICKLKEGRKK